MLPLAKTVAMSGDGRKPYFAVLLLASVEMGRTALVAYL
jgi:hypothetical protein